MSLSPCTSCARHVRRTESACPFCGAVLALEAAPTRVISERLGRAALFSIGAAAITNLVGCGASTGIPSPSAPDAGQVAMRHDVGTVLAAYGGGPHILPDAGKDADPGCCSADYGGPPMP